MIAPTFRRPIAEVDGPTDAQLLAAHVAGDDRAFTLLMERHAIELVADRALNRCVAQAAWDSITQRLTVALRAHQYENGLQSALEQISGLLITHFPSSDARPRDNTVSDAPVVLP